MSAEKIFCGESPAFLFVFWALFMVLIDGLSSVCWCFVVRFNILCGAILHGLWCGLPMLTGYSAGKEISREEGTYPLLPSSIISGSGFCSDVINFRLE